MRGTLVDRIARLKPIWLAAMLGPVLFSTACGKSSDEQGQGTPLIRTTVDRFHRAAAEGDGQGACALLTSRAQEEVLEQIEAERECDDALTSSSGRQAGRIPRVTLIASEADEGLAVVRVNRSPDETYVYGLKKDDGGWLIDSLGPVPPPDSLEGSSADSEAALEAVEQYEQARNSRNGETACNLLLPQAARRLGESYRPPKDSAKASGASSCELAVNATPTGANSPREFDEAIAIGGVGLGYANDGVVLLIRTRERWLISHLAIGAL